MTVSEAAADGLRAWEAEGRGYLKIQSTRPHTLAYAERFTPGAARLDRRVKEWTNPPPSFPKTPSIVTTC